MIEKFENKIEEEYGEIRLEKIRKELKDLKKENLEKKKRGENYDPHFDNMDPDKLEKEELSLFQRLKEAATREELDKLEKEFNSYREKTRDRVVGELRTQPDLKEEEFDKVFFGHPKVNFTGFFGNELLRKQVPFLKEDLKKYSRK